MNKRHTGKLLAFLLAVVFMFTLIPQVFADGGKDITGKTYIHKTDGSSADGDWTNPQPGGSSVEIKENNELFPADGDGNYSDVPAGAAITIFLGFHFKDIDTYGFEVGDYFMFPLPKGVLYSGSGGSVPSVGLPFAEWSYEEDGVKVTLTDGFEDSAWEWDIWGDLTIEGTFVELENADDDAKSTEVDFAGDIIKIDREDYIPGVPSEDFSTLEKSYEYDPETNELHWEVTVTPPAPDADDQQAYDYGGFTIIDKLTGKHVYKDGSFVVTVDGNPIDIDQSEVIVSTDEKTITYVFPESFLAEQTVMVAYTTQIEEIESGSNKTNRFQNTASLKDGDQPMALDVTKTFELGEFFIKSGEDAVFDEDIGAWFVQWIVHVILPVTEDPFTFGNARIIDELTSGNHEYVTSNDDYPVEIIYPDGSNLPVAELTDEGQKGVYEVVSEGSSLIYHFDDNAPTTSTTKQTYTLKYFTKIDPDGLGDNTEVDVRNKARFEWGTTGEPGEPGGPGSAGPGWGIDDVEVIKEVAGRGGRIEKGPTPENVVFDYSKDDSTREHLYIQWTIVVNRSRVHMEKARIEDAVQPGHKLELSVNHPLTVQKNEEVALGYTAEGVTANGTLALNTGGDGFIFTFPENDQNKYTIVFYTKIDADGLKLLYGNGSKAFKNTVTLFDELLTGGIPVTGTRTYSIQMLNKSIIEAYDHSNRMIQYKLVVNRNRLPMTNAIVTDALPDHLELVSDNAVYPVQVSVNGATATDLDAAGITTYTLTSGGFELTLPTTVTGEIGDKYEITYWAHLKNEALLVSGEKIYENTAKLILAENPNGVTSKTTTKFRYDTILKKHDYKGGETVTWRVEINPGQAMILPGAFIEDTIEDYLEFSYEAPALPVSLYEATVNANGQLAEGSQVDIASLSLLTYDENNPSYFKLNLPENSEKAYILKFVTKILEDKKLVKNHISLRGGTGSPTGESDSKEFQSSRVYANGGSGSKVLRVLKLDEKGEPMPGVTFRLLTSDLEEFFFRNTNPPEEKTTDSNGIAEFTGLPNWIFYVQEIVPLEGYLLADDGYGPGISGGVRPSDMLDGYTDLNIEVVNRLGLADFSIKKMDHRKNADERAGLPGAVFELVNDESTDTEEFRQVQTSAAGGIVNFENIPLGTYTIQEVESPAGGYKAISGTLTVTVDYNDDFTDTVVEFVEPSDLDIVWDGEHYVFINRFMGKIEITKVGETENLLEDVGFRLLVKDGEDFNEYLDADNYGRQGKTGPDGTLIFDELPPGKYYLEEISAPDEYALPGEDELVEVIIPSDGIYHIQKKLTNELLRAFIQISKEGPNGELLDGGLFELTKPGDTSFQAKRMPAEEGVVTFEELLPGTYQIEEIEPPLGYAINEESKIVEVELRIDEPNQLFDIEADGEGSKIIKNDYDGKITINKRGASGALRDVTFELLQTLVGSTEPTEVIATQKTNDLGIAEFSGLPLGTYYIRETAVPGQYHLPSTLHKVELTAEVNEEKETVGWHQELEIRNYLLTDSIILTKTDPKGVALDGGWFGLYTNSEATGDPIDKVQADGGQVVFSGILPGTYYVREIEAPSGYIKSDEIIKVNVSLAGTNGIVGEVVKEPLVNTWAGGIKLVKVDEKGEPLAGAVFELLDANKKVIKEGTSGKDGVIEFKELAMGTYYLREKTAPAGYAKLMELTEVVLKAGAEADMVKTVKLANHRNLASVTLRKTNQYDGVVSGGLFGIYKTDDTGFKNPLQKVASVKGMIIFTDLEAGQYFIREIEAPKHHKLTGEFVKVVLEVNPDTGLLEDVEIEEPLLNETPLTEEEWDEKVEGDEDDKDNGEKDDDLVETGSFLDTAMLWFFGTLLILAGAILLLRMRAALVRK